MASIVRDGWHDFHGIKIWVENGRVIYGRKDGEIVHPYRINYERSFGGKLVANGTKECSGVTLETLRAIYKAGHLTDWRVCDE